MKPSPEAQCRQTLPKESRTNWADVLGTEHRPAAANDLRGRFGLFRVLGTCSGCCTGHRRQATKGNGTSESKKRPRRNGDATAVQVTRPCQLPGSKNISKRRRTTDDPQALFHVELNCHHHNTAVSRSFYSRFAHHWLPPTTHLLHPSGRGRDRSRCISPLVSHGFAHSSPRCRPFHLLRAAFANFSRGGTSPVFQKINKRFLNVQIRGLLSLRTRLMDYPTSLPTFARRQRKPISRGRQ